MNELKAELEEKKESSRHLLPAGHVTVGSLLMFVTLELVFGKIFRGASLFSLMWWIVQVMAILFTILLETEIRFISKAGLRKEIKKLEQAIAEKQAALEDREWEEEPYPETDFTEAEEIHLRIPYRGKSKEEKKQCTAEIRKIQIYRQLKWKKGKTESNLKKRYWITHSSVAVLLMFGLLFPFWSSALGIGGMYVLYLVLMTVYGISLRSLYQTDCFEIDFTKQSWSVTCGKINIHGFCKDLVTIEEYEHAFFIGDKNKKSECLIGKDRFTEEEILQLRAFFKTYFREYYSYEEIPPHVKVDSNGKMVLKLTVLCALFLLAVFCLNRCFETRPDSKPKPPVVDNFRPRKHIPEEVPKQEEKHRVIQGMNEDGTFVKTVEDEADLHLNTRTLRIEDCYTTNVTNGISHFFLRDNVLMGASMNENGELGLGHCEPDYNAKGFLRYEEITENVRHIALGDTFMVYITDDNQLWGTGNIPGTGQCLTPTFLMEHVQYAACGSASILLLKEDGTAWMVGNLGEGIDYPQYTQVLDRVKYVSAAGNVAAAVREDDTLWMWGDNQYGQCGVSDEKLDVTQISVPRQVLDEVKVVWVGRLQFNSTLVDLKEPSELYGTENRTYIQRTDSTTYVCGESTGEDTGRTFVPLKVVEE